MLTLRDVDGRWPVIVGAGQITHRRELGDAFIEPYVLIAQALQAAAADAGNGGEALLARAKSVRCVAVSGWQYRDAAALVATRLGLTPRETVQTSPFGGDAPQRLINETAQAIIDGDLDVALIAGGEAVASMRAARRHGGPPRWTTQANNVTPTRISGHDQYPVNDAEGTVGLAAPLDMYALIETALCAAAGEGQAAHLHRISELWAGFSTIAAENPHAWLRTPYSAAQITTPSKDNRTVAYPYTKLLSANILVDQAAGLIICSAQAARDAGVPSDRWVFVHAGAQAQDEWHVSERPELTTSPALRAISAAALTHAGIGIDDVAHVDLYSCFPAAVELAADALGLALDDPGRPLSATGGMTFAGGPGNNYTTHAIATLVRDLRADPGSVGLATAMGWYATKHALGLYSTTPPPRPFRSLHPQPDLAPPRRARTDYTGPAVVEAFTVQRDRDGKPYGAAVAALTPQGERALIGPQEHDLMRALLDEDLLGAPITVLGPTRFARG